MGARAENRWPRVGRADGRCQARVGGQLGDVKLSAGAFKERSGATSSVESGATASGCSDAGGPRGGISEIERSSQPRAEHFPEVVFEIAVLVS